MRVRGIPKSIKERLRLKLQENAGSVVKSSILARRMRLVEDMRRRLKERLRARLVENVRRRLRERLRMRLLEGMRRRLRERLRMRLVESDISNIDNIRSRLRARLRERLLESRADVLRRRIRARLFERRGILGRLCRRSLLERGLGRRKLGDILLRSRLAERVGFGGLRKRDGMRILEDGSILRVRLARLEKELKRKTQLLKEAYKIVKRVEELGGIDRIEKAMMLAYDTLIKAGSKMFKESVEKLASETGVDKKKVALLIKKVGLKEAREVLRGRRKRDVGARTIIVEGMGEPKEQFPVLAMRVLEKLSRQVDVSNPKDIKNLSEVVFKK